METVYGWGITRDTSMHVMYCVGPQDEEDYPEQGFMYEQLIAQMFQFDEVSLWNALKDD